MEVLAKWIESLFYPWGMLTVIVFGLAWILHVGALIRNPHSRITALASLNEDSPGKRYRGWMTGGLDWLDARLSKAESALPATSARVAWSGGLAGVNFILATAYPILSVLALWVVTGKGLVAGRVVIPVEASDLLRWSVAAAFCVLAGGFVFAEFRLKGWLKSVVQLISASLFLAIALWSDLAVAVAFAFAFAGAFTVAVPGAFAGAGAFTVAGAVAVAVAFAGTVAAAGTYIALMRAERLGRGCAAAGLAGLVFSIVVIAAVILTPEYGFRSDGVDSAALILFVSLLPLLNGLADFASCGLTRLLMRRGANGQPFWRGVADSLAGLGIFILLGCTSIAVVHFVRPQSGVPLADLPALFDGLTDPATRGQYGWLLFMLGTTLIPTLLHFIVAVAAFFTLYPAWLRHWIAAKITEGADGHENAGKQGQAVLALAMTAAAMIPSWLGWQAFTMRYGLLDGFIWLFHAFALGIGAIPPGAAI